MICHNQTDPRRPESASFGAVREADQSDCRDQRTIPIHRGQKTEAQDKGILSAQKPALARLPATFLHLLQKGFQSFTGDVPIEIVGGKVTLVEKLGMLLLRFIDGDRRRSRMQLLKYLTDVALLASDPFCQGLTRR